jgi:hypothetical protein
MGTVPYLLNGTEKVTTFGVMFRMTITSAGLAGMSLDDMLLPLAEVENGFRERYPVNTPRPMAAAGNRRKAVPKGPGRFLFVE